MFRRCTSLAQMLMALLEPEKSHLRHILFHQCLFLITGLISTLGAQWLNYWKAADSKSLLTVLCTYIGMVLVVCLPITQPTIPQRTTSLNHAIPLMNRSQSSRQTNKNTNIQSPLLDDPLADTVEWEIEEEDLISKSRARANPNPLWKESVDHKGVFWVGVLDVLGQAILTIGLFFVGSGVSEAIKGDIDEKLYQVIYSSVIVFASIYNRFFLKRSMSEWQWMAVIMITLGLSLNAFPRDSHPAHTTTPHARRDSTSAEDHASRIVAGFFLTLFGTAIYSGVYTLNDYLLTSPGAKKTTPRAQCFWVGVYCGVLCLILMSFVSIPSLMSMPLNEPRVVILYGILILSSFGHNVAYFELVNSTGAVATGVLQALRAVLVFGLSHIFFCSQDAAQCFDERKWLVTLIVIAGVLAFAFAKAAASRVAPAIYQPVSTPDAELSLGMGEEGFIPMEKQSSLNRKQY